MYKPIKIWVRHAKDLCGFVQSEDFSIERDTNTVGSQSVAFLIFLELSDSLLKGVIFVVTHPIKGSRSIDSSCFTGSSQRHCLSVPRDKDAISLNTSSTFYPAAIFWTIDAIGIDAIKLCPREPSRSHVSHEILKRFPSFTNYDRRSFFAASVILIALPVRVVAAIAHVNPCPIQRAWTACVSVSEGKFFSPATSAAFGVSAAQMGGRGDEFLSTKFMPAVASDNHPSVPIFSASPWSVSENGKWPELTTNDVY